MKTRNGAFSFLPLAWLFFSGYCQQTSLFSFQNQVNIPRCLFLPSLLSYRFFCRAEGQAERQSRSLAEWLREWHGDASSSTSPKRPGFEVVLFVVTHKEPC